MIECKWNSISTLKCIPLAEIQSKGVKKVQKHPSRLEWTIYISDRTWSIPAGNLNQPNSILAASIWSKSPFPKRKNNKAIKLTQIKNPICTYSRLIFTAPKKQVASPFYYSSFVRHHRFGQMTRKITLPKTSTFISQNKRTWSLNFFFSLLRSLMYANYSCHLAAKVIKLEVDFFARVVLSHLRYSVEHNVVWQKKIAQNGCDLWNRHDKKLGCGQKLRDAIELMKTNTTVLNWKDTQTWKITKNCCKKLL